MNSNRTHITTLILLLAILTSNISKAAPSSDLWSYWTTHQTESIDSIDHSSWTELLTKRVITSRQNISLIAYADFTESDKKQLTRYINTLSQINILNYSKPEQLAYWINIYNALTIKVVLYHYPVESIREIKLSGFFSSGPWKEELIKVNKKSLSLNDIEHRILRPIWKDPRIHYAVNCASIGCPNLQPIAFTAKNSNVLLTHAAVEFINHSRAVRIEDQELIVSSIYSWFEEDFGDDESSVIKHLMTYAKPSLKQQLSTFEDYDHQYDWQLNDLTKSSE